MTVSFDLADNLVIVDAEIEGPSGNLGIQLVLDTGTSQTIVRQGLLPRLGFYSTGATSSVVSAGGGLTMTEFTVVRLAALNDVEHNFSILAADLPLSVPADGLLGLDFLRGKELRIDFQTGEIELQ